MLDVVLEEQDPADLQNLIIEILVLLLENARNSLLEALYLLDNGIEIFLPPVQTHQHFHQHPQMLFIDISKFLMTKLRLAMSLDAIHNISLQLEHLP
jgi:hypothetical protein